MKEAEDRSDPVPRTLTQHCHGNPMMNSDQCQWIAADVSNDGDKTASVATEMTYVESVTQMSMISSSYETHENGPADMCKPMARIERELQKICLTLNMSDGARSWSTIWEF